MAVVCGWGGGGREQYTNKGNVLTRVRRFVGAVDKVGLEWRIWDC